MELPLSVAKVAFHPEHDEWRLLAGPVIVTTMLRPPGYETAKAVRDLVQQALLETAKGTL